MSELPDPAGPDHNPEASSAPEKDETLPGDALPRRDTPPSNTPPSNTRPSDTPSDVGVSIGPYQLRQKLGAGGMGEVWLAEQQHPIRRRVALKIIKRGMDTREVILRFEAERQAREQADHTSVDVDTRSDVYSLGVILYELITGALPFSSKELRAAP